MSIIYTRNGCNRTLHCAALQPLPPTYTAHLDGLPGFTASVDYSVTAIASKTKNIKLGIGVTCVSFLFGILCTEVRAWTVTEKKACERTGPSRRPSSTALALGLRGGSRRAWSRQKSAPACDRRPSGERTKIKSRRGFRAPRLRETSPAKYEPLFFALFSLSLLPNADLTKIYTPASHVLCMRRAIPYHITFTGPALALATLLTYLPSRAGAAPGRACSQIQVLRQASVDVKCVFSLPTHPSDPPPLPPFPLK